MHTAKLSHALFAGPAVPPNNYTLLYISYVKEMYSSPADTPAALYWYLLPYLPGGYLHKKCGYAVVVTVRSVVCSDYRVTPHSCLHDRSTSSFDTHTVSHNRVTITREEPQSHVTPHVISSHLTTTRCGPRSNRVVVRHLEERILNVVAGI